jgi:hypothetical protein
MGGLTSWMTEFVAFTKGHPAPTTTRFLDVRDNVLGAVGGVATRGAVLSDGLMFNGLEDGPEGMYAIAFGFGGGKERFPPTWVCETGDFSSARLVRPTTVRGPLGKADCCGIGLDRGKTSNTTLLLEATALLVVFGEFKDGGDKGRVEVEAEVAGNTGPEAEDVVGCDFGIDVWN